MGLEWIFPLTTREEGQPTDSLEGQAPGRGLYPAGLGVAFVLTGWRSLCRSGKMLGGDHQGETQKGAGLGPGLVKTVEGGPLIPWAGTCDIISRNPLSWLAWTCCRERGLRPR